MIIIVIIRHPGSPLDTGLSPAIMQYIAGALHVMCTCGRNIEISVMNWVCVAHCCLKIHTVE